jgi:hypothetical protein
MKNYANQEKPRITVPIEWFADFVVLFFKSCSVVSPLPTSSAAIINFGANPAAATHHDFQSRLKVQV